MTTSSFPARSGWRILAFGKHPEIAASVQQTLRSLGFQAKVFALTDDAAGDARLIEELHAATFDGVSIGVNRARARQAALNHIEWADNHSSITATSDSPRAR